MIYSACVQLKRSRLIKRYLSKKPELLCKQALESVKELLPKDQYIDCEDYILKHNEWLLGLECAIDYLGDEEATISVSIYKKFEYAFLKMNQQNNARLIALSKLVKSKGATSNE